MKINVQKHANDKTRATLIHRFVNMDRFLSVDYDLYQLQTQQTNYESIGNKNVDRNILWL